MSKVKFLKPEYKELQDNFLKAGSCCSCHSNPPCGHCTDPGNPDNLAETDDAWIVMDHADLVKALVKDPNLILQQLTPQMVDAWHAGTGAAGEAGELLDAVKKYAVYNKPVDRENVVEELGDLEFYMEALRKTLSITREETLQYNAEKLSVRYASGVYSDQQAQARADKQAGE